MVWCRVTVQHPVRSDSSSLVLSGNGPPDLSVVDVLARMALVAARKGSVLVLSEVAPTLEELLVLAGLRVQMLGEIEGAEEPLRVQHGEEEAERSDLPGRRLDDLDRPRGETSQGIRLVLGEGGAAVGP